MYHIVVGCVNIGNMLLDSQWAIPKTNTKWNFRYTQSCTPFGNVLLFCLRNVFHSDRFPYTFVKYYKAISKERECGCVVYV